MNIQFGSLCCGHGNSAANVKFSANNAGAPAAQAPVPGARAPSQGLQQPLPSFGNRGWFAPVQELLGKPTQRIVGKAVKEWTV